MGSPAPSALVPRGEAGARAGREAFVARALRLEFLTVAWNVAEGVIALAAALAAGSIVLAGFGFDSFVESASGLVLIWRLSAERRARCGEDIERLDRSAHRLVGLSLFALAAYVAANAVHALASQRRPEESVIGIALTVVSLAVMVWLARAKRQAAAALGSRALAADAFQTTACWWLSLITLGGLALNGALGWWWADPLAALLMTPLLVREGLEAFRGEPTCGCHTPPPVS